MRNLKKVLSLALALVMLLGMMVVGAGAAEYKDAANIGADYKEGIDVLTGIKVMQGRTASSFQPEGTLTRAEAATIITRALLGRSVADALANTDSSFNDMQGHWAAGAVEYCVNNGIVVGTSATTFTPGRPVSSMEFTAMVLRALGLVDAKNPAGGNWKTETIAVAAKNGLSDSTLVVSNANMKRQEAAKMAFNGILYSPSGEKAYKVGNQTFDNAFDAYVYAQNNGGKIEITTAKDSLASTVHNLSKADATANGRTGYTWQVNGKDITGFIPTDKELYAGTAISLANTGVKADSSVEYYLNGAKKAEGDLTGKYIRGNELILVDVNGNGKYDKVLLIEKTFATVNADPAERNGKLTIAGVLTGATNVDKVSGWEGLAEGDNVLKYTLADGITYIEKLETVEGAVTGRTGKTTTELTWFVDGSSYKVAQNADSNATENLTAALGEKDGVRLYLDKFAVVWAVESAIVKPSNYAVLTDIVWVKGVVTAGGSDSGYAEAQLLLTDGTTVKYRIDSINGAKPVGAVNSKKDVDLVGKDSGKYVKQDTLENLLKTSTTSAVQGSDNGTALVGGNYYGFATSATALDHTKGLWIALNDVNKNSGTLNDSLEGQFYTFAETGTAGHATLKTVGMDQKTGAMADSKVYIKQTNSAPNGNAYVQGAPNMTYNVNNDTIPLNNGTKFLLKNGDKYYAYTGIAGENAMVSVKGTPAPSFMAVIDKNTGIATHVYVVGEAKVDTKSEVVFVTNTEWNYNASTKTYTFEAIVDGDVNGTIETTKTTEVRDVINAIGLYTVERASDGKITSAAKATVSGNVMVASSSGTIPAVEKANLVVIKIGNDSYTYSDDTRVFYVDADGTASSGAATSVGKYDTNELAGVWAVVKNGGGNDAQKAALTDLYLLAKSATDSTDPATGFVIDLVNGENVVYDVSEANKDTIKAKVKTTGATDTSTKYTVTVKTWLLGETGSWVDLGTTTGDEVTANGTTAVEASVEVPVVKGKIYKFDVTVKAGDQVVHTETKSNVINNA